MFSKIAELKPVERGWIDRIKISSKYTCTPSNNPLQLWQECKISMEILISRNREKIVYLSKIYFL